MGDQERGQAGGARMLEHEGAEPIAQRAVELAERLVEQQRPGLGQQRAHQRDPRALAAGQGGRVAPGEAGQIRLAQRRLDARPPLAPATHRRRQRERQVLADRQVGKQQIVLEQDADAPALGRQLVDRNAVEPDLARRLEHRLERAAQVAEQARFAAAARAHHRGHGAGSHLEVEPAQQVVAADPQRDLDQAQAAHLRRPPHMARRWRKRQADTARASAKPQERQRREREAEPADDPPVAAAGQAQGLGGERAEAAAAGEQGRQELRDADREADGHGDQEGAQQHDQLDPQPDEPRRLAERQGDAPVARVQAAVGIGERQEHVRQDEQEVAPDHRQPAVVQPEPEEQHLDPEQEADLRHQERHVEQGKRAGARAPLAAALVLETARDEHDRHGGRGEADRKRGPGRLRERGELIPPARQRPRLRQSVREAPAARERPQREAEQTAERAPEQDAPRRARRRSAGAPPGPPRPPWTSHGLRQPARAELRARARARSPGPRCRAAGRRPQRPGSAWSDRVPGTSGTAGPQASAAWSGRARSPCRPPTAHRRAPRTPAGGSAEQVLEGSLFVPMKKFWLRRL